MESGFNTPRTPEEPVFPTIPHIVFDAYTDSYNVKADPDLFLDQFAGPVIFDEVQYVPELLLH